MVGLNYSTERKEENRFTSLKNILHTKKSILDWRPNTGIEFKKRLVPLTYSKPDFPDIFCDGKQPLYCYKPSSFPVSHRVISMQTSPWTWSLGVTFGARFLWYMVYIIEQGIFIARLVWFMAYKTRNIIIGACLFPFMAFIAYIYDPCQSSMQIVRIVRTVTHCALM